MKKIILSLCLLFPFVPSSASAEEGVFSGILAPGIRAINLDAESAKFYEYNGLRSGIFGGIFLNYDSEGYHASFSGEDIGLDDQYYKLNGGRWGGFKYALYFNQTPHNYSFNDRTFYSNAGSTTLDYASASVPSNPDLWSIFGYKVTRKDLGGSVDFALSPSVSVTFGANRMTRSGLYPVGAPSGVFRTIGPGGSPFGNVIEMPAPVDNITNTANLEIAYRTKPVFFSLSGIMSGYNSGAEWLTFRNPYVTSQPLYETLSLPPDNKFWKLRLSGALKLPLESTLAVNAGYSRLTSTVSLLNTIWTSSSNPTTYKLATLGLNDSTFNGDITYKNVSAVLTSSPARSLSTKVYLKYLEKNNGSDEITYTLGNYSVTNHLFGYKKNNAGAEVGYKLAKNLKATLGFDYLQLNRVRPDIPETRDSAYSAQLKFMPSGILGGRLKYQRLYRRATFESPGVPPSDPLYIENFIRRYDATDKTQDAFRVSVDISPAETLSLTAEYTLKSDNYAETILGKTKSRRNEYIIDASYEHASARVFGYFDYEEVNTDQTSRYINPTGTYSYDPSTAPVNNSYNWYTTLRDTNYAYGAGIDVPFQAGKLVFSSQYDFEKTSGKADFTSQVLTGTLTQDSIDMPSYGDYRLERVSVRLKYVMKKNLNFILGYQHETYTNSDAQFTGYQYVVTGAGNPNTYLTGAYANESYRANIFYFKTSCSF